MNILVIAPHPDDETLGCGGTLCHHVRRGDRVSIVFLTSGELGLKPLAHEKAWAIREAEAFRAAEILGATDCSFLRCRDWRLNEEVGKVADLLVPVLQKSVPEIIYLPHPQDRHPDHQVTLTIVRSALNGLQRQGPILRGYEIWTPLSAYDLYENISSVMGTKLKALRAHQSQLREYHYLKAITALNRYRGILAAKAMYAEVFLTLREVEPPREQASPKPDLTDSPQ